MPMSRIAPDSVRTAGALAQASAHLGASIGKLPGLWTELQLAGYPEAATVQFRSMMLGS